MTCKIFHWGLMWYWERNVFKEHWYAEFIVDQGEMAHWYVEEEKEDFYLSLEIEMIHDEY